jgi:DNA-binding GntR family transcriptional regulator
MYERRGRVYFKDGFSQSSTCLAYVSIRRHILTGRYRSHHKIPVAQVVECLGIPGASVREAATLLIQHGYMRNDSRYALVTREWNDKAVEGWSTLRETLAILATRRVAVRKNRHFDFLESILDFSLPDDPIDEQHMEDFIMRTRFFCEGIAGMSEIDDLQAIYRAIDTPALHRMTFMAATCDELRLLWSKIITIVDCIAKGLSNQAAIHMRNFFSQCKKLLRKHIFQIEMQAKKHNVTFESMEQEALADTKCNHLELCMPFFGLGLVDFDCFNNYLSARQFVGRVVGG